MKFYIPTSSLNIENILSTESISPLCFYSKRDFGYNRFFPIYDYNATVLLFSDIVTFTVDNTDMQCYPVIIEVEIDLDKNKNITKINIPRLKDIELYGCDKTIFLQPNSTRILFYDIVAMRYTKLGCDDSALNKLGAFWKYGLIEQHSKKYIKLSEILKKLPKHKSAPAVLFDDNNYNRAKGLIYGYILGEIMSKPNEIAQMLNKQKRIYDIVSALNSGTRNYQFIQELEMLDKEYSDLDPTKQLLRRKWKNEVKDKLKIDSDELDSFLRNFDGAEALIKQQFCKHLNIPVRRTFPYFGQSGIVQYIEELDAHISKLLTKCIDDKLQNINISSEFDLQPDCSRVMMLREDDTSMLFNKILARIIWKDKIIDTERIRVDKFNLATDIVFIIKNIWEDQGKVWNESPEQNYFHQLRCSIRDFSETFDIKCIDNVIMQSIAAIILKGNDYKELKSYLESTEFSNYSYVMGLWGAITGYVSIPREVFKELACHTQFSNIYEAVSSIYGIAANCSLEVYEEEIDYYTHNLIESQDKDEVRNLLRNALEDNKFKQKQINDILTAYDEFGSCLSKKFLDAVCKLKGIGKVAQKKLESIFNDLLGNNEPVQPMIDSQSNAQLSIFENTQPKYFYNDPMAWWHIEKILPQKYHQKVKRDFDWFINMIKQPQMARTHYAHIDQENNERVIHAFCNLKKHEGDGITRPEETERNNLCNKLLKVYGTIK